MTQNTSSTRGYGRFLKAILICCDLVVINVGFLVLVLLMPEIANGGMVRLTLLLLNVAYIPTALLFTRARLERSIHMDRLLRMAVQSVGVQAIVFLGLMTVSHMMIRPAFMWQLLFMFALLIPMSWLVEQQLLKVVRRRGRNFVRVIIVGTNPTARALLEAIERNVSYGYRFMGFFDLKPHDTFSGPLQGDLDDLATFVREQHVDEIYYCLSGDKTHVMERVLHIAEDNMARFAYVPQLNRYATTNFYLSNVGSIPVLQSHRNRLENPLNQGLKRAFDIVFSGLFLLISPIIFIPVAIAIKLSSPGPVFFRQKRTGYRGEDFTCLKFRTMRVNADSDSRQATVDDPRKTRVGEFLRRTSIDELPQFINVFKGDMSVVGPRPHMLKHTQDYRKLISQYMVRHQIKPGVTGWAQVNGFRGPTDELWKMEKRVAHDVWYIEHWSFTLDLKIIARTVYNALRGEENAN